MTIEEFIFCRKDDGSYVRKLFGFETLMAHTGEYLDGSPHITVTASITLPHGLSKGKLYEKAKEAWIALRRQVPGMAVRGFRFEDGMKHFAIRYDIPQTKEDVEKWVEETLVFHDENNTFLKWHYHLRDNVWWTGSANRYSAELHYSPSEKESEWSFSLSTNHSILDGRATFGVLEIFFDYLQVALVGVGKAADNIAWGDEVSRLQQPATFIPAIVATGSPPAITAEALLPRLDTVEAPPPIWTFALPSTGLTRDTYRRVKFSKEESVAIYNAAKAHGKSITQLISALQILAFAEAAINHAGQEGEQRFNEVVSSYDAATHHSICLNAIDYRVKLPGGYDNFRSTVGSPVLGAGCLPLYIPIEGVKRLLTIDKEKRTTTRTTDVLAFWDVLTQGVADAWEKVDRSLDHYLEMAVINQGFADHGYYSPSAFLNGTYTLVSSTGDLDRLGVLNAYFPSDDATPFKITDIILSARLRSTCLSCLTYQINGELQCHFSTALDNHEQDEFDRAIDAFLEWVKLVL